MEETNTSEQLVYLPFVYLLVLIIHTSIPFFSHNIRYSYIITTPKAISKVIQYQLYGITYS